MQRQLCLEKSVKIKISISMNFVAKCCQPLGILGDFAVDRWKFIDFKRPGILRPSPCTNTEWNSPLMIYNGEKCYQKYTQFCRIKGCGGAGCPHPPIIFERLNLPQQIIYRRKENLSESPNHQKYWENILVSRFYEQFSRNRRNLGHFRKFEKISNS